MKFRLLHTSEYAQFDEDFKHFLILNGISNEEWLELNQSDKKKAQGLVELFSDIVFQKVYENVRYLEFRSPQRLLVFHCEKETIHLIGLESNNRNVDFSNEQSVQSSIREHFSSIHLFKTSKPYSTNRELELFQMTENGALVSTKERWDTLHKLCA